MCVQGHRVHFELRIQPDEIAALAMESLQSEARTKLPAHE